jgi:hypothetical protein
MTMNLIRRAACPRAILQRFTMLYKSRFNDLQRRVSIYTSLAPMLPY